MINKQNLWFVTLFSIILVLGIYYLTIGDEKLSTLYSNNEVIKVAGNVDESDLIVALQIKKDEEVLSEINEYQNILLDHKSTLEEKNEAYEALQMINNTKTECEKIERLIKEKLNYDNFVKISKDNINIVISSKDHSNTIANNIIRLVQSIYDTPKYITVKFE